MPHWTPSGFKSTPNADSARIGHPRTYFYERLFCASTLSLSSSATRASARAGAAPYTLPNHCSIAFWSTGLMLQNMAGQFGHRIVVLVDGGTHSEQSLGVGLIDENLDLSFDLLVQVAQCLRPLVHGVEVSGGPLATDRCSYVCQGLFKRFLQAAELMPSTWPRTGQRLISLENWSEVGRPKTWPRNSLMASATRLAPVSLKLSATIPHRRTMWRLAP